MSQQGAVDRSRERESRHLWVGGLPDNIDEVGIRDHFTRFGKIEGVKILPQKYPNIGVAAFIDFYDIKSATEAKEAKHKLNGNELRTNFKANAGEIKFEGGKSQDRERESDSSSSGSESGSSSSSSSSDSERETAQTKRGKKKLGASGGGGGGGGGGGSGSLYIKVTGLASRPERVLQDGLYYEFCRYSTNVVVKMYMDEEKKWAMIKFKRADRCREAFTQSQGMILFGSKIKLTLMELDDFPQGGHDPGHGSYHHQEGEGQPSLLPPLLPPNQFMREDLDPLATRSLFVGNIPKNISVYELRDAFLRYGNVLDVEIKKMGGNATYGFILYYDLMSAVTAKQYMDGHNLKGNSIRVGFGKGTSSKQIWIDGIDPSLSESHLERHLTKYGKILKLGIDRQRCCAIVQFDSLEATKDALNSVKGTYIKNSRRLMTDFANRDARAAFFSRVESTDVGIPPQRGFPAPPGGRMYASDMIGDPRMMMPPRPGDMHMMGRGGGGFHPRGHPMDYYYNPFMEDYYGGRGGGGRPPFGPPGMHRFPPGHPGARGGPFGREGPDDYEEELLAFSRKREREKRVKRRETSSESGESNNSAASNDEEVEELELRKKRKANRGKDRTKRSVKKIKGRDVSDEGETGSESDKEQEGARLKATRKSRDLREKLKKKAARKKMKYVSSDEDNSEEEDVRGNDKPKSKREHKSADVSPTEWNKRKGHKIPPSPDRRSPSTPPTIHRRIKEEPEDVPSDTDSDLDKTSRSHDGGKDHQRKKERESAREEDHKTDKVAHHYSHGTAKSKVTAHLETPNGDAASAKLDEDNDKDCRGSGGTDPMRRGGGGGGADAGPMRRGGSGGGGGADAGPMRRGGSGGADAGPMRRGGGGGDDADLRRYGGDDTNPRRRGGGGGDADPRRRGVGADDADLRSRGGADDADPRRRGGGGADDADLRSRGGADDADPRRRGGGGADDADLRSRGGADDADPRRRGGGGDIDPRRHGVGDADSRRRGGGADDADPRRRGGGGGGGDDADPRRHGGGADDADPRRRGGGADDADLRRHGGGADHAVPPTEAKVETPQSPVQSSSKSSRSPIVAVESELSSGEDFKEKETEAPKREKSRSHKREKNEDSGGEMDRRPLLSPSYSPSCRRPRTPDYPLEEAEWKGSDRIPHTPPLLLSEEEEDGRGSRGVARKSRKLPRRYQIEPSNEPGGVVPGGGRRDGTRRREGKDVRQERRYHNQIPSPPSPPMSYGGHPRKRHYHSSPPPEGLERRRHRGRPYSPGGHQRRRHSRSPLGSPPHRGKSPYVSPPPHSRPRSPIPRLRGGPRHRYESPPFEGQRGKFSRGRVSPPSPHHRFPYSPTPPPPRGTSGRSPTVRRYVRRRSASVSPPRGRVNRRERSPASDYMRSSPRPPPEDQRYDPVKRHSKRAVYSRTPSPKDKYRDMVKEEYPESKRRRMEELHPKSPSGTPPPSSREGTKTELSKATRQQQSHQSHSSQSSSEQRGFKLSNPTATTQHSSSHHHQTSSVEPSNKSTLPTQALPKTQSNPVAPPENNLMDLLRRYPVMWQGHLMLKNDAAAVQLHFLSGNVQLAHSSLPQQTEQRTPILRISQRMRLEKSQLEGVDRRIQTDGEHCLLLALPCGRDASDVHTQTHALKVNLIHYLLQKQAAGIINVPGGQSGYVLHIFPPCPFSQSHLSRVAPDLLSSASDNCHLMIVVATM